MSALTDRIAAVLRYEWKPEYGNYDEMAEWTAHVAERIESELVITGPNPIGVEGYAALLIRLDASEVESS